MSHPCRDPSGGSRVAERSSVQSRCRSSLVSILVARTVRKGGSVRVSLCVSEPVIGLSLSHLDSVDSFTPCLPLTRTCSPMPCRASNCPTTALPGRERDPTSFQIYTCRPTSEEPPLIPPGIDSQTPSSGLYKVLDLNTRTSVDSEVDRSFRRVIGPFHQALDSVVVSTDLFRRVRLCLILPLESSCGLLP